MLNKQVGLELGINEIKAESVKMMLKMKANSVAELVKNGCEAWPDTGENLRAAIRKAMKELRPVRGRLLYLIA